MISGRFLQHLIFNSFLPQEILIGILGNMTSVRDVRMHLSQSNYIHFFISLLSSSDALTLLQLVRLLNSCVWHVNNNSRLLDEKDEDEEQDFVAEINAWITQLEELAPDVNEHLSFILRSSTNGMPPPVFMFLTVK